MSLKSRESQPAPEPVWPQQSPIDIREPTYYVDGLSRLLELDYRGPVCGQLKDDTHEIELSEEADAFATFDGVRCKLIKIHFHMRSEHRVDGADRFMEVHLVHAIPGVAGMASKLLVVGVFLEEPHGAAAHAGASEFEFLLQVFGSQAPTPPPRAKGQEQGITVDLSRLLPAARDKFWHYEGSLTTPGFDEVVSWVVLRDAVTLDAISERLAEHTTKPARAAQPLSRRFVLRSFEEPRPGAGDRR